MIAIFNAQFMPIWIAVFALGNSGLAFLAMETGRRLQSLGCMLTSAFLVYLTYIHLHELTKV